MQKVMQTETSFRSPVERVGKSVQQAPNSAEALRLAGLDWMVNARPIHVDGVEVPNQFANVRSSDKRVMGIVSKKYKIVQNHEAFEFTNHLLENDLGIPVTYESAGAFQGGQRVFLSARLPETTIVDDAFTPYLFFTNNHDGKGSVRVAITPMRIVCSNMISMVLKNAERSWSTRHVGDILTKTKDARTALLNATRYMDALKSEAEQLASLKVTSRMFEAVLKELFPIKADTSPLVLERLREHRDIFSDLHREKADLQNLAGTGWGLMQTIADFESHVSPNRLTSSFEERRLMSFVDGRVDRFRIAQEVLEAVA